MRSIFILIISIAFLGIGFGVQADEAVIDVYGTISGSVGADGQTFKATSTNITAIGVYAWQSGSAPHTSMNLIICRGGTLSSSVFIGSSPNKDVQCVGTDELVYSVNLISFPEYSEPLAEFKITFSEPITTYKGEEFHFAFSIRDHTISQKRLLYSNGYNIYDDGRMHTMATGDIVFKIYSDYTPEGEWVGEGIEGGGGVEIISPNFPEWNVTTESISGQVDYFSLESDVSDWETPVKDICFVDEDCYITIYFNELAKGKKLYFFRENELGGYFIGDEDFSFTIPNTYKTEYQFLVSPTATSSMEYKYYLLMENAFYWNPVIDDYGFGDKIKGGNKIIWLEREEYEFHFDFFDDPCDDVASSTGSFADDFRYGLECGIRKTISWLFVPTAGSAIKLKESYDIITYMFPMSLWTKSKDYFTVSTSTPFALTVNFTDLTGIQGYDTDLVLAGKETMTPWGELWTTVRRMEGLLYITLASLFIMYHLFLVRFANREASEKT